jgi:uncharacterized caspase-like protein
MTIVGPKRSVAIRCLFAVALLCTFAASQQPAENSSAPMLPRRALVVGMSAYQAAPLTRLERTVPDARALRDALSDLGFHVTYVEDAPRIRFDMAVNEFVGTIQKGDVVLVYYAGHGMQIRGEDYLVPVDYDAVGEPDAEHQAYPVSTLLRRLQEKDTKLDIIILDACRTNRSMPAGAASGLAKIEAAEFPGTYIAMATSPGKTTPDSSPFAEQLVAALKKPESTLDEVFNEVRKNVSELTHRLQVPSSWSTSDIGDFTFRDSAQSEYSLALLQADITRLEEKVKEDQQRKTESQQKQRDETGKDKQERQQLTARLEQVRKKRDQEEVEKKNRLELERNRQAEELSKQDAELARQEAAARAKLEALRQQVQQGEASEVLSLDDARKHVAVARSRMADKRKAILAEKDSEIAEIDVVYSKRRRERAQPITKDMFETSAEFAQRRRKQEELLRSLDREWSTKKAKSASDYDTELAAQEKPLQDQIESLTTRLYVAEPLAVTWNNYNADSNSLTVAAGPFLYGFEVPPAKAKELYDQRDSLRLESKYRYQEEGAPPLREDIVLLDLRGERFAKIDLPHGLAHPESRHTGGNVRPSDTSVVIDAVGMMARDREYWSNNRFDEFEVGSSEELEVGSTLTFTMVHPHVIRNVHPVKVSVSRKTITFKVISSGLAVNGADSVNGPPSSCDLDHMSTDIRNVVSSEVTTNKQGEVFLILKIRDGNNSADIHIVSLADQYASKQKWVSKGALGIGLVRRSVRSRPEAERALTAVQHTIQRAAAQAKAMP